MQLVINYKDWNGYIKQVSSTDLDNINYYKKTPTAGRTEIFINDEELADLQKLDFSWNYNVGILPTLEEQYDNIYFIMAFNEPIKVFNGTRHSLEKSFCLVKLLKNDKYKILSSDNKIYEPGDDHIFRTKNIYRYFIPLKFN
jgi:hypothetical protein